MKKKIISICISTVLAMSTFSGLTVSAKELPKQFWGINDKYSAAVQAKDYANVAKYGSEAVDLILGEPATEQTSNIIGSRAYEAAFAYYFLGDYANAVKYFKIYIPYGIEQNWPDGVKIAENFILQLTPRLEVYKQTPNEQKYFGARCEPHGVLYGQVSETMQNNESMVLLYLTYGNVSEFQWGKIIMDKARDEGKSVEIALNFASEGYDVRNVNTTDGYISSLANFLSGYSDVPIFLRIGAEVNIWGNTCTPNEFKTAFRLIAERMRTMPNVASVWSVAHTSRWKSEDWPYTAHDFYPGDDCVDWVGVNAYPTKYFNGQLWYGVEKFNEICFKSGYSADPVLMIEDIVNTYGDRKPIMISECGSAYKTTGDINEEHHEWAVERLKEMYSHIPMVYPQVKIIAYFNKNMPNEKNYYDLHGSQQLANEYNVITRSPWFIQNRNDNNASVYFEKVYDNISIAGNLELGVYPHLYGSDSIIVDFYLDGEWSQSAYNAPYTAKFSNLKGNHTLDVVATGSNGNSEKRTYYIKNLIMPDSADDFKDTSELSGTQKIAVDKMLQKGVITGYDDNTIRPLATITRAEFATMVCRLMGYTADKACSFNDAWSHWGTRYIEACVSSGAINGVDGNNFEPDSNITFEQAVKIIAVVKKIADSTAEYPYGFISASENAGLLYDLTDTSVGAPLTRIDAAVLMANASK